MSETSVGRTTLLGRRGSVRSFNLGDGSPLRIVAPFGVSGERDLDKDLLHAIQAATDAGADAVQELSTFGPISRSRQTILKYVPVPYGTVLTYEFVQALQTVPAPTAKQIENVLLTVLDRQIEQGVDYITIHAALSTHVISRVSAYLADRAIPMPSRAGGMLIHIMRQLHIDNPLHSHFTTLAKRCADAGVLISLGATFRPAAIADAIDVPHLAELGAQGELAASARQVGARLMLEGLSHGTPADLAEYVAHATRLCPDVPVTALGPLPTDIAAGMDDVAAAIGVMFAALAGIALVNVVSAKEHLAMPTPEDTANAVRAARIGVHVADVIRAGRQSERDRRLSLARGRLDWDGQVEFALFPDLCRTLIERDGLSNHQPCNICETRCPLMWTEKLKRDDAGLTDAQV